MYKKQETTQTIHLNQSNLDVDLPAISNCELAVLGIVGQQHDLKKNKKQTNTILKLKSNGKVLIGSI